MEGISISRGERSPKLHSDPGFQRETRLQEFSCAEMGGDFWRNSCSVGAC